MKNKFLFIIALSLISIHGIAQNKSGDLRDKFMFGIKAGGNYSNVYDTQGDSFETESRLGFAGGVFLAIPIGKHIGIQPEVFYSQKGFKATGTILGSPYSVTRTTNYIDVPLLLSVKPLPILNLVLGPQFSYLLKQTDTFSDGHTTSQQVQEFKDANIRKNIMGFVTGFDINPGRAVFSARAGWDYLNNNGDGTTATPRYKNMWLQATLGIRF